MGITRKVIQEMYGRIVQAFTRPMHDPSAHPLPGALHADSALRPPGSVPRCLGSKRATLFLLFHVFCGVIFLPSFAPLWSFSLQQDNYPHFSLILLVFLYLMSVRRQRLVACMEYCVWGGIPTVLVGVLVYLLGRHLHQSLSQTDVLALTTSGILIAWIGGFVTCCGLRAARIACFPLAFLIFVIPLPERLLGHLITGLQYGSAEVTDVLFQLIDLPTFRDGTYFALPGLKIEVARECSSIRSSMALLITSVLVSHMLLRRWWSKAVVLLLVFPLAICKNGIRIVTLSLLTIYVDKGFMHGNLHTRGGAVFFGLACVILLGILLGLRKLEARQLACH